MIATGEYIRKLRERGRLKITSEQEKKILKEYGSELHSGNYSEQDLYEQIRKLILSD